MGCKLSSVKRKNSQPSTTTTSTAVAAAHKTANNNRANTTTATTTTQPSHLLVDSNGKKTVPDASDHGVIAVTLDSPFNKLPPHHGNAGAGGIAGGAPSSSGASTVGDDIRKRYRLGHMLGSGSFGQVRICVNRQTGEQFAVKIMSKHPPHNKPGSKRGGGGGECVQQNTATVADHHHHRHHHNNNNEGGAETTVGAAGGPSGPGGPGGPTTTTDKHSQPSINLTTMFRNEMDILHALSPHPNVVRFIEMYEDANFLYGVMEKCEGGELFTKIVNQRKFTEEDASKLTRQMLEAIRYVHSQQIVHRDIKAENFLFADRSKESRLVLIDFGMSVKLTSDDRVLKQVCGSPHYVAPELIRRNYRFEVDMWALGIVLYLMLYGRYPFEGQSQKQIAQQIIRCHPEYHRTASPPSPLAIDFMKRLLEKSPSKRMNPEQALEHMWVSPGIRAPLTIFRISEMVVKQAIRKTSMERHAARNNEIYDQRQKEFEQRLSAAEERYEREQGSSSGGELSTRALVNRESLNRIVTTAALMT